MKIEIIIDDKIIHFLKKVFQIKIILPALVILVILKGAMMIHAAVTIPHTFADGTTIYANEVNENFSYIIARLWDKSGSDLTTSNNVQVSGNLKVTGSFLGSADYIWIQDEKPSDTHGGTFTKDIWQTRDLNTEKLDTGGHATLSSNQITLAAGTYRVLATAPGYDVTRHQARLYNVTNSTTLVAGTPEYSKSNNSRPSVIRGQFTISESKTLELQHFCLTTIASYGYGVTTTGSGETQVYSVIELWRISD